MFQLSIIAIKITDHHRPPIIVLIVSEETVDISESIVATEEYDVVVQHPSKYTIIVVAVAAARWHTNM
jgi:hypothetical protein